MLDIVQILNAVAIPAFGLLLLVPLTFFLNSFNVYQQFLSWLRPRPAASMRHMGVVITGASSGIGEELALEFSRRGASVLLAARREGRLQSVARLCLQLGATNAVVHRTDVSKVSDCKAMIEAAVTHFGTVDILVNNAGTAHSGLVFDIASAIVDDPVTASTIRSTMDVDFWGNVWPTVYALPHLRNSRGSILVTASAAAYLTFPRQAFYNAAKAAIVQFYDTMRVEVDPSSGVSITVALPGFVRSELTTKADAKTHIPWWWPMLPASEAARLMVNAVEQRRHYVVVPFWYSTWLLYRAFASVTMDWSQRIILLGKAPTRLVGRTISLVMQPAAAALSWLRGFRYTQRED